MRVLIIEDDKWFAESLSSIITGQGGVSPIPEVSVAHDPETAIQIIDSWQPDLILLDVMLGAKNGLTLLHELQSYIDTRSTPVVVMSVEGKRLKLDDLRELGVVAVIDKTELTPEILLGAINVK
jgi:CheY-like chemotaxis protein